MARRACDGDGLLAAFRAAVTNLEAHEDEINSLNVYPVPDGDTGSNMLATVKAALEEAEGAAGQPAHRIAAAISFGALMGARGNSGVITSQIDELAVRQARLKAERDGLRKQMEGQLWPAFADQYPPTKPLFKAIAAAR